MANHTSHNVAVIIYCILLFSGLGCFSSYGQFEDGGVPVENYLRLNKGVLKTIQSQDGDVIDCVDILKQPSVENSDDKTIKLKPSSYPSGMKQNITHYGLRQIWQKSGECPEGTIPMRRSPKGFYYRADPSTNRFVTNRHGLNLSATRHEYAVGHVNSGGKKFFGGKASINLWNPQPERYEFSLSQIWIAANSPQGVNTIEVGWIVYPYKYKDSQTRMFVYWTSNGYKGQGCYDLDCIGFKQVSNKVSVGSAIDPTSIYGKTAYNMSITVFKDSGGDWWLEVNGESIGYWPGSLFTGFTNGAERFESGGETVNRRNNGHFTTTPMGSGDFPSEGYLKASYVSDYQFVDNTNIWKPVKKIAKTVTFPNCYDLDLQPATSTGQGISFFYGGPGYSAKCP